MASMFGASESVGETIEQPSPPILGNTSRPMLARTKSSTPEETVNWPTLCCTALRSVRRFGGPGFEALPGNGATHINWWLVPFVQVSPDHVGDHGRMVGGTDSGLRLLVASVIKLEMCGHFFLTARPPSIPTPRVRLLAHSPPSSECEGEIDRTAEKPCVGTTGAPCCCDCRCTSATTCWSRATSPTGSAVGNVGSRIGSLCLYLPQEVFPDGDTLHINFSIVFGLLQRLSGCSNRRIVLQEKFLRSGQILLRDVNLLLQ